MFVHWFVFEITIQTNNWDKRLIIQFIKKTHNLPVLKDVFYILFKIFSQEDNEILYNPSNIKDKRNKNRGNENKQWKSNYKLQKPPNYFEKKTTFKTHTHTHFCFPINVIFSIMITCIFITIHSFSSFFILNRKHDFFSVWPSNLTRF